MLLGQAEDEKGQAEEELSAARLAVADAHDAAERLVAAQVLLACKSNLLTSQNRVWLSTSSQYSEVPVWHGAGWEPGDQITVPGVLKPC